jgi:hypothetical protein
MIAARDEIHAGSKHFFGGGRSQTKTARGIFAVGDAGIHIELVAREPDASFKRVAARRADDVANE